jgi:hypothetical protein
MFLNVFCLPFIIIVNLFIYIVTHNCLQLSTSDGETNSDIAFSVSDVKSKYKVWPIRIVAFLSLTIQWFWHIFSGLSRYWL